MKILSIILLLTLTSCTYTSHTLGTVSAKKVDASLKGSTDKPKATLERWMRITFFAREEK